MVNAEGRMLKIDDKIFEKLGMCENLTSVNFSGCEMISRF